MLNPLFLWFLPLAALPVLLHLLNLFRLREVEIPTYRFLMQGYVQQRRRIRLVEWILMALRTSIVLLAVLALSRPVAERLPGLFGGTGRDVVFVVDASMTTGLVTEGSSAIHRIRETVRGAVGRLAPADFVTLVRAGVEPKVLYRAARGDGRRLVAELDTLEPDPGTADLASAIVEAMSSPPRGRRTLWIVSDCERRTWKRLGAAAAAARVPTETQLVVANLGGEEAAGVRNLAILGDPPRSQRPVVGLPVELALRIEGCGFDAPLETKATVQLDDEIVAQVPLRIAPGRTTVHTLPLFPRRAGVIEGRVDLPPDAFPEDDSLLFVLNVEPRVGVLVITPAGLDPIFDPAIFLRAALESPRAATGDGTDGKPSRDVSDSESEIARSLDVTVASAESLDERLVKAADVIFLIEQRIDPGRLTWIRNHVEAGAGLIVVAGSQKHGGDDLAGLLGSRKESPGVPMRLAAAIGDIDDETAAHSLESVDFSHPVFAPFRPRDDAEKDLNSLGSLRIFRHEPVETLGLEETAGDQARRQPATVVLARLDDGTAVIVESRLGRGRVVVSGLAATPDWSNLPVQPAFVPIMLRLVQHVRPPPTVTAAESVRACEPAPIRLEGPWRRAGVQVITPSGGRRAIQPVAGDDGATAALDDTAAVGFYAFDVEPPTDVAAKPVRLGLAVNRDVDTAAFARAEKGEIDACFAPHPVMHLAGTAEDPTLHEQLAGRHEVWRWLIATMFGLFGVEFALSTLRPPSPADGGDRPRTWSARINDWLARAVGNMGETSSA